MSKNLQPTIDYLTRGADDYLARMEASKAEEQATRKTHYASAQELRQHSHASQMSSAYMQAMIDCIALRSHAMMTRYTQTCLQRANATAHSAQIKTLHDLKADACKRSQIKSTNRPLAVKRLQPIATTHASNAPNAGALSQLFRRQRQST